MTELIVAGLSKSFGPNTVLRGVDLNVASGSLVAILGPSGSGKTTLLRLVCGFERADGGTIRIGDDIVSGRSRHVAPEQRHIGYVAQAVCFRISRSPTTSSSVCRGASVRRAIAWLSCWSW